MPPPHKIFHAKEFSAHNFQGGLGHADEELKLVWHRFVFKGIMLNK